MNIQEQKLKVAMNMKKYGGAFVKGLGEALMHADADNARKIKTTWPSYWNEYLNWGNQ